MDNQKEFEKNKERIELETAVNERMIERAEFINQMRSRKVFGKLIYFAWKKKLDMLLLSVTIVALGSFAGLLGKAIWEIWKVIFAVEV